MRIKKLRLLGYLILAGFLFFACANFYILRTSSSHIFSNPDEVPESQAALILGARVYQNGRMSDVLADRTIRALELYENNKVEKLLVSGDHGTAEYDEVNVVKDYLLNEGVPADDIFLDHAGFDTYDSLYRAKVIFQIDSLIVVTQEFHLPRAIYIGRAMEMETSGYIADRQTYIKARWNSFRESLARTKTFIDVLVNAKPEYFGDPIPITGDGQLSWG